MKKIMVSLAIVAFGLTTLVSADSLDSLKGYRSYMEVGEVDISVPTAVEVDLSDVSFERNDFAVYNLTEDEFEPYKYFDSSSQSLVQQGVSVNGSEDNNLSDNNYSSFGEYELNNGGLGAVSFEVDLDEEVEPSSFSISLDNNVAMPTTVSVDAEVEGLRKVILAKTSMSSTTISFPKNRSNKWFITLEYVQPLRVTELRLNQDNASTEVNKSLRFLAQPDGYYWLYLDSDRYAGIDTGEAPDLYSDDDVLRLETFDVTENTDYELPDQDNDGVSDYSDNCVSVPNSDQEDINNNNRGDACDDFDRDGVMNHEDNCVNEPNSIQRDDDVDGIGNECDSEESRLTERNPWLVWVGMGAAAAVVVALFVVTFNKKS